MYLGDRTCLQNNWGDLYGEVRGSDGARAGFFTFACHLCY